MISSWHQRLVEQRSLLVFPFCRVHLLTSLFSKAHHLVLVQVAVEVHAVPPVVVAVAVVVAVEVVEEEAVAV
jgi:hypothetical protein